MIELSSAQLLRMANQHIQGGRLEEARAAFLKVLDQEPQNTDAMNGLAVLEIQAGRAGGAIELLRRAMALRPGEGAHHCNLGYALQTQGLHAEAIPCFREALRLRPGLAAAHMKLGLSLCVCGQVDEGIASYREGLRLAPGDAAGWYNLGFALLTRGAIDEAIRAFREVVRFFPGFLAARTCLGRALSQVAEHDAAVECHAQVVAVEPGNAAAHSDLMYAMQFQPGCTAEMLYEEGRRWQERHGVPVRGLIRPHGNIRDAGRRLKVGYVSADFIDHVAGRVIMPLLERRDRAGIEVICYSNALREDEWTGRFRGAAGEWRRIESLSDEAAAEQIRADGIDVLVDLSSHMPGNRLLVFARRPAPVQVTFAYPGSTGLGAMDYRMTDPHLDPPGMFDHLYSEKSERFGESYWCFDPLEIKFEVGERVGGNDGVTFGCLNGMSKLNAGVLELWGRLMKRVEGSRLVLLASEESLRGRVLGIFEAAGVEASRVRFVARQAREAYFALHREIDVALDPFPYNGHTTSLDALWMGVPVVTLVGNRVVGRGGLSQLMNLGLPELIGRTPEEYVEIAAGLARDRERIAEYRKTLRGRMEGSVLMDRDRYVRNVEGAYRRMWSAWCAGGAG